MVKRYPHTATLSYFTPGTYNSVGVYEEGTLVTIGIVCNIQPNASRYILGESGDMIGYSYNVFSPLFAGAGSVPARAKLQFFNKEHVILQLFEYQKHVEMKC